MSTKKDLLNLTTTGIEEKMFDVVCLGHALIDITVKVSNSYIDSLGYKKGSMNLVEEERQRHILSSLSSFDKLISPGGSSSNVASGVACLGGKSAFLGKIGFDKQGSFFENSLSDKGVVPKLSKSPLCTGSTITFITADGERTFSTHLGAATSLNRDDLSCIPASKFFHVEAYLLENPALRNSIFNICKSLKEKNVKISFDLSDSSLIERIGDVILEFLSLVDVVFANIDEAEALTKKIGLDAAKKLNSLCDMSVVKKGSAGSLIVSKGKVIFVSCDAVKPVNTNGAGDAFAAGFLFALANNHSLKKAGTIASFIAREVVLESGASLSKDLSYKIKKIHS